MPVPSYTVPTANSANATEEPKIITALQEIKNTLNGALDAANLANNAVTTAKITDNSVTTGKIADLNVTTAKIAADSVIMSKIADDAVTVAKLTPNISVASASSDLTPLPSTETDIAGCNVTTTQAGNYLVHATIHFVASEAALGVSGLFTAVGRLSVGGVIQAAEVCLSHRQSLSGAEAMGIGASVYQQWYLTGVAASATIKLRALYTQNTSTTLRVEADNTRLIVQQVA